MIRKIKGFVLIALASLAFFALAPISASGEEFHSETAHTIWDGAQTIAENDVYTFNAGTAKCREMNYAGTTSTTTPTTVSLTPWFSECTAFGFAEAVIHVNGCEYQYHIEKEGSSTQGMSIVCPEGKAIVITALNCHVSIGSQVGLKTITYSTEGAGKTRDIKITPSITGLKYTQVSKAFPGCANGTFTNGAFKGVTTVKGTNTEGSEVGIWVDEPDPPDPPAGTEFHSEAAHTLWTAAQFGEDAYTFKAGTAKCTNITYQGTTSTSTGNTISLTPSFSGCTAFGFVSSSVHVNGCEYLYHNKKEGMSLEIVCPEGKSMLITAFNCHVSIGSQAGLGGVTYANERSGKVQDIRITHSITGLKYTQASKSFPGCTNGEFTDGKYTGLTTLKGTNTEGSQIGVGVEKLLPTSDEFQSEAAHTTWSGSQIGQDAYTFTAGTWKCTSKTDAGTSTTTVSTTLSLTPSFSGCTGSSTVDVNGCEYRYHTQKEGSSTQGMSIVCPEGKAIVITTSSCHLTIPAQSGLTGVSYANEGGFGDIKITHSITGLKYTQASKEFPGCADGEFTNGTYGGSTTLKGKNTAGQQIGVLVF